MTHEKELKPLPGALMLMVNLILFAAAAYGVFVMVRAGEAGEGVSPWMIAGDVLTWIIASVMPGGFFTVEPNGSKVMVLFGTYRGTVKQTGFHWVNPFNSKRDVSLRARTFNGERLKVNDLTGNPIEIATIIVWQVIDTFKASFDVEQYIDYVALQTETSLRHMASSYPYDANDHEVSLIRNTDEISQHLQDELQARLARAGVNVLEARLSHLAYAPEIAGVMLRKQQASAIIAARKQIVDGAVGMVQMALEHLEQRDVVSLDEERKAAMVTNLLVVLCSESAAQPVLNTGTLYP
jgi:regulator of protease activity HflC (stomatin/prohibitin superfamily)